MRQSRYDEYSVVDSRRTRTYPSVSGRTTEGGVTHVVPYMYSMSRESDLCSIVRSNSCGVGGGMGMFDMMMVRVQEASTGFSYAGIQCVNIYCHCPLSQAQWWSHS